MFLFIIDFIFKQIIHIYELHILWRLENHNSITSSFSYRLILNYFASNYTFKFLSIDLILFLLLLWLFIIFFFIITIILLCLRLCHNDWPIPL